MKGQKEFMKGLELSEKFYIEHGENMLRENFSELQKYIAVGLVGMVLVALAYPLYNRVLKKQREKIAPEILRLSDELLK